MREFLICPATLDHAMALSPHVRPEDRLEWVAGTGDPLRLRLAAAVSDPEGVARSVFVSGVDHPILIWGVQKHQGEAGVGQAWLIASTEAVPFATSLHGLIRTELPILEEAFPRVVAYADKRNSVHLRWLRWMGFASVREVRLGPWNLPFLQFERSTNDVCSNPGSYRGRDAGRRLDGGGECGS